MQLLAKPWMLEPQLLKESAKDSLKRVWKLHWVGVAPALSPKMDGGVAVIFSPAITMAGFVFIFSPSFYAGFCFEHLTI